MKSTTTVWRITAAVTAMSMTLGTSFPASAAPPPIAVSNAVSPPDRVGRLAQFSGTVSFHTADQTTWSPATLNYPITTGNALWTEPSADALIEVSGNRLAMDSATEFDIATLDDHALIGSAPQGELYLSLRNVPNGDTYTIQTPRGAVQIAAVGRYEVVAGDSDHPTTVTVVEGAAQITGTNLSLQVRAGQMASLNGTTDFQGAVGPMHQDAFLTKMLAQERPATRSTVAIPPVVASMTGCQDLDQYGAWTETPQYGSIWYPKVETGWVPYRHGRWSYVAPWGWTWVDDAAWGFAPFHYGRWIQTDDRWGWVPADPGIQSYPRPVYAPALVSWVDIGAAAAAGAEAGALLANRGDRSVGWVPLGPNEPYYPPYSHSLNYVRAVNGPNIRNVTTVINQVNVQGGMGNRTVVQNFINRGGATVVPAGVMAQSAPISGAARAIPPQQFAQARAQVQSPIAPTAATVGVTAAVARQFNFTPAPRPGVAGPAINPATFHTGTGRGTAPGFVPPLRPAAAGAAPAVPHPAEPPGPEPSNTAPRPNEPGRLAGPPGSAIEPGRTGGLASPEPVRPGVMPELRPAAPPGAEANRPPGIGVPPGIARPAEPGHPGIPSALEAARPGAAPELRPAIPAGVAPGRQPGGAPPQATRPSEPRRPATSGPTGPGVGAMATPRVGEPQRQPAPAQSPRPAPVVQQPRPAPVAPVHAPQARPAPAMQPPRPAEPQHVAPAPRPAPPPRPAPVSRPAPPPHPATPHPEPKEEHH